MSAFKEMVWRDREVFVNLDEFAEEHRIEGRVTLVVLDSDALGEKMEKLGLAQSTLLFRAKVEALPPRKAPGNVLNFDGAEYTVQSWDVDAGVATVILSEPEGM